MKQMSLEDLFEVQIKEETTKKEELIEKEKPLKKNEKVAKKEKGSQETKKKVSAETFKLPCVVYGGPYTFQMKGEGETTLRKITSFAKTTFPELDGNFKIQKVHNRVELTVNLTENKAEQKNLVSGIKLGTAFTKSVAGKIGKEAIEDFLIEYPEYFNAKFYISKDHIVVPFFKTKTKQLLRRYPTPVRVGFTKDCINELTFDTETVTEQQILEVLHQTHPEYRSLIYFEEQGFFMPMLFEQSINKKTSRFCLPIAVHTGGYKIEFSEEDFEMKEVTLEDIRKELEKEFPEYSKERTSMEYDLKHFVIAQLVSSKKGATIMPAKKGYKIKETKQTATHVYPYGKFVFTKKDKTLSFEMLQKIPGDILRSIRSLFLETPTYERAAQVFLTKNGYELYIPPQIAKKDTVEFFRNIKKEKEDCLVMDIHSHGAFEASFSKVDNEDETGIRLYMVLGNMDKEQETVKLRAGYKGNFCPLFVNDVFDLKEDKADII